MFTTHTHHTSSPPCSPSSPLSLFSGSLLVFMILLALGGCAPSDPTGASSCSEEERATAVSPQDECYTPCEGDECLRVPSAHSVECLDTSGPLCLLSVQWRDELPRRGAITPGERVLFESITLSNEGETPLNLERLNLSPQTAGLSFEEGGLSLLSLAGEGCEEGVLAPHSACELTLNVGLLIADDAASDQRQSLIASLSYQEGGREGRADLSAPFLVVSPTLGLSLEELTLDDSTRDGALNPGDRARFNTITLLNHSLAPFEALQGLVSTSSGWLSPVGRGEMWSEDEVVSTGLTTEGFVRCEPATITAEGERQPTPCTLTLEAPFELDPEVPVGEVIELSLRLKERDERVGEPLVWTFEVEPLAQAVLFEGLTLNSDQDQDGQAAPGERVTFHELTLNNIGESALSLQGRLSVADERVEVLEGSELSVDLRAEEGAFYERCAQGERCVAPVRLRLQLSPELEEGDEVEVSLALRDQRGEVYELSWRFEIQRPDVELELAELRVTQDTLDERLSGGERGLVSYLKLINVGDADALGLDGELWSDSPYVFTAEGEGVSAPVSLRQMGADSVEGGACLSTQRNRDAYCYQRLNVSFEVSEEAPIGTPITFWLDLTDALGRSYQLSYELELF